MVILRESNVHIHGIAGFHANQLILKTGDESVAAQSEGIFFPFAALKGHAVDKALKVDNRGVAAFHCSARRQIYDMRNALLHMLNFIVNILFGGHVKLFFHLNTLIFA